MLFVINTLYRYYLKRTTNIEVAELIQMVIVYDNFCEYHLEIIVKQLLNNSLFKHYFLLFLQTRKFKNIIMAKLRALTAFMLLFIAAFSSCSHNDGDSTTYTLLGEESYRQPIEDSITQPLLELMAEKGLIDLETMRSQHRMKKDLIPPFIEGQFVMDSTIVAATTMEGKNEGDTIHKIYLMFSKQNNGTAQFNGKELLDAVQIPAIQIYGWDSTFYASLSHPKRFNGTPCEIRVVITGNMQYDESSGTNTAINNIIYGWVVTQAPETQDSLVPNIGDMEVYYELNQKASAQEWLIMQQ